MAAKKRKPSRSAAIKELTGLIPSMSTDDVRRILNEAKADLSNRTESAVRDELVDKIFQDPKFKPLSDRLESILYPRIKVELDVRFCVAGDNLDLVEVDYDQFVIEKSYEKNLHALKKKFEALVKKHGGQEHLAYLWGSFTDSC